MKHPHRGLRIVTTVLVFGVLAVSGYRFLPWDEFPEIIRAIHALPWYVWAIMLLLQVFTLAVTGLQWSLLIHQEGRPAPFLPVMSRYLAGNLVEAVTPSSKLGGESTRAILFHRRFGTPYGRIVSATVVRAACLYIALAIVLASAFVPAVSPVVVILGLAALPVVRTMLRRRGITLPSRPVTSYLFGSSLLIWILYPLKLGLFAHFLGIPVPPAVIVSATYGAYLVGLMPFTPGGLGVYEAGMTGILYTGGVTPADAILLTLALRTVTYWWPLLLSVLAWVAVYAPVGRMNVTTTRARYHGAPR